MRDLSNRILQGRPFSGSDDVNLPVGLIHWRLDVRRPHAGHFPGMPQTEGRPSLRDPRAGIRAPGPGPRLPLPARGATGGPRGLPWRALRSRELHSQWAHLASLGARADAAREEGARSRERRLASPRSSTPAFRDWISARTGDLGRPPESGAPGPPHPATPRRPPPHVDGAHAGVLAARAAAARSRWRVCGEAANTLRCSLGVQSKASTACMHVGPGPVFRW